MTEPSPRSLPDPVARAIDAWLGHHDRLAPGVVEGLYVVGSVALGDWTPRSDIDVVAFVADPTDVDTVARLEAAHDAYRAGGGRPSVDGPVLSWVDVASPPMSVQRAWTLDGEFRFDAECFEINPVVWLTLAEHGIAVRGPVPGELDVVVDDSARRDWVRRNVDTYWRAVRADVRAILDGDLDRNAFGGHTVEWCALGVARMWFTAESGGVVSKHAAGEWAAERLPQYADLFAVASEVRSGEAEQVVGRATIEQLVAAMGEMIVSIV